MFCCFGLTWTFEFTTFSGFMFLQAIYPVSNIVIFNANELLIVILGYDHRGL